MRSRISIVTAGEVSVVGCNNCIFFTFFDVFTVPLSDTWATSVGKNGATEFPKCLSLKKMLEK